MVQVVTFNDKVECHHYNPTATQTQEIQPNVDINHPQEMEPSNVRRQSRFTYSYRFLKELRNVPLSQGCPDVVKKGIEEEKGWTGSSTTDPPTFLSVRQYKGGNGNTRQPNPQNNRPRPRNWVPFFDNYQNNYGGSDRDELNQPIQPVGANRVGGQHKNYFRNSVHDFGESTYTGTGTRNLFPEFIHRSTMKNTNDEDAEPEWISHGPLSKNDCIALGGFPAHVSQENRCNTSDGPTSGASSNNGSPPAKSTPAKVTPTTLNDNQRNKRPAVGRSNNWQNNFDNRQTGGAPALNEFFKNFSSAHNQSNSRGLTPIPRVEDVESSLLYDRMRFRQMIAQMHNQNLCKNLAYAQNEPVPTASQILAEIDKILRTSTDPVCKRPEVRTLITNIVEAVIPPINIMNLLKNPLTEPQNRETIQSALKLITQAKHNATNAMKMRTPTELELRAHMDAILQDAIIKKKMENLRNELLKVPYQQSGRNFSNQQYQSFHQLLRQNSAGRFENRSQSDSRGQCQSFENGTTPAPESNLNRWFSPTLLNKGLSGELPQIPSDPLRSEELEGRIKQKMRGNEKEVK